MRVILVNFTSTYHRLVAREAIRKGAKVTHVFYIPNYKDPDGSVADPENSEKDHYCIDPEFNGTKLIDLRELQYADSILKRFGSSKSCVSESLLLDLAECEAVFMRHSDRFSFYPTSATTRRRIYHSLLAYLLDVLEESLADTVFFADSPHVGFDTVLFYLAKHMGIRTVIIEKTHLDNSSFLIEDYRSFPKVPESFMEDESLPELLARLEKTRFGKIFDVEESPKSLRMIWQKHQKMVATESMKDRKAAIPERSQWTRAKKAIKSALRVRSRKEDERDVEMYSRAVVFNSLRSSREIQPTYEEYEARKTELREIYKELSNPAPDIGVPYIFFPLHMQPEKTTSAFGGVFEDQYLALKILSQSIPEGCHIYVKEHPAQLVSSRIENMHYRDRGYYEFLAGIPGVKFVGLDVPYRELMERASFCATITGSVGWESMIRGKPVVIFGSSWYSSCPACFRVSSVVECRSAIARMSDWDRPAVEKAVARYALYYSTMFLPFATNPRHVKSYDLTYDDQIRQYAGVISSFVEGND